MADCHASVDLARRVWNPTSERNLFWAFTPYAHSYLKRIAAEFTLRFFNATFRRTRTLVFFFVKACIALYRKLPVNWAQFAVRTNVKTPAFKPHPRWCILHVEDDVENGLKVDGLYDNMLVLDGR
jgi:hypothetical protein